MIKPHDLYLTLPEIELTIVHDGLDEHGKPWFAVEDHHDDRFSSIKYEEEFSRWIFFSQDQENPLSFKLYSDEPHNHSWLIPINWRPTLEMFENYNIEFEPFDKFNEHFEKRLVKWQPRHHHNISEKQREFVLAVFYCFQQLSIKEGKNFPPEMVESVLGFLTCLISF